MNRRSFLKRFACVVGTVLLPLSIISYDPVKQVVVKPKIDNSILVGYKGNRFLECGYIYAPYMPLYITKL